MRGCPRRKKIRKKFETRGYRLKVEAIDKILNFADPSTHEATVDFLLDLLQRESLKSSTLDAETIQRLISHLLSCPDAPEEESNETASSFAFIDAFDVPKFRYDSATKRFILDDEINPLHGEASAKTELYRERFMLLRQRVSRSEHFSRLAFDAETSRFKKHKISSTQSLKFKMGNKWVMGLISQLEDGHFYLEDLSASVEIDLSKAKITTGFFTENTIILAEGEMQNGIFQNRLGALERRANDTFVILSDIWLDDEEVLGKLEKLLDHFESVETVPSLFVFMGNFCSRPCNLSIASFSSLRQEFGKLGRMIGNHPRLKENSQFLFIPGPDDPGPSTVLPRCRLPNHLTEELRNVIPNAKILSNPCRLKFYNREIVFFRQDLLYRTRRSCLITPSSEEAADLFQHLVYTITHQSHLCPLPLMAQPIIWNYDHCLRLYPTPHTIVLVDKSEQKVCEFGGTTCFNPGSFSTDSTYVAYRPSTQEVKLSAL